MHAVDNSIRTWWQANGDALPQWLEVDLEGEFLVNSSRTMFADRGLDYKNNVLPAPYKYRILGTLDGLNWDILCDQSENSQEKHIEFDIWEPRKTKRVRLEILSVPPGMIASVWEFTVFGFPQM